MYQKSWYNLTHAQSVCTRLSFPSCPAPSGEPGFEANFCHDVSVLVLTGKYSVFSWKTQLEMFGFV